MNVLRVVRHGQLHERQERLRTGKPFAYSSDGRRDPFRSLYATMDEVKGPRPKGVAGLLVTELDLTGIVKDPNGGDVALVIGSDTKGYFLRVGDVVYDGTLIGIDSGIGTVTFRQKINDPRRIKPYQDIVKTLDQLEDEERTR